MLCPLTTCARVRLLLFLRNMTRIGINVQIAIEIILYIVVWRIDASRLPQVSPRRWQEQRRWSCKNVHWDMDMTSLRLREHYDSTGCSSCCAHAWQCIVGCLWTPSWTRRRFRFFRADNRKGRQRILAAELIYFAIFFTERSIWRKYTIADHTYDERVEQW